MTGDYSSAQENLATIKQGIIAIPVIYEFSSYVEYLCNKEIGEFTEAEIERAGEHFIPVVERIAHYHNTAEQLKQTLSRVQLNTGAAILGFCAVASEFVEDVRHMPKQDYWAIWFCIEILQHTAVNNIVLSANLVKAVDDYVHGFVVPTGQVIAYRTLPISLEQRPHLRKFNIVELKRVQRKKTATV